jgi:uncharacterized protein (DUF433 family)
MAHGIGGMRRGSGRRFLLARPQRSPDDGAAVARRAVMAQERIETRPDVMFGKPVIRGTRIPVELILRKLAAGQTPDEILRQHPRLTLEDIRAAQAYAADVVAGEEVAFG